jgi:hypothetical protein
MVAKSTPLHEGDDVSRNRDDRGPEGKAGRGSIKRKGCDISAAPYRCGGYIVLMRESRCVMCVDIKWLLMQSGPNLLNEDKSYYTHEIPAVKIGI